MYGTGTRLAPIPKRRCTTRPRWSIPRLAVSTRATPSSSRDTRNRRGNSSSPRDTRNQPAITHRRITTQVD